MERHKCKLCTRTFANGRALGGHMKAHLATLPLPPKTMSIQQQPGNRTESASSSYSSSGEEQEIKNTEVEEKALVYGLRENPKKSFRFADPEFSFAIDAGSVVQDRESETESRNPTRRRSKRTRKSGFAENQKLNFDFKKLKLKNPSLLESTSPSPSPSQSPSPSPAEPEPVSSVSDTSPEEDVAMCLMMLSRDVWLPNNEELEQEQEEQEQEEIKANKIRGKLRCEKCSKVFRSSQALVAHKRICSLNATELKKNHDGNERIFECPYCFKVFGSGQALGGHKRSHLMGTSTTITALAENSAKLEKSNSLIDLNLPAPVEEDDFSVVSDA
ncbi:hypothetical protein JCGZ_03406 [Jatropha curcas]|uniref:C2H2-type domain-containing protein n=1 Tax=Jatropha curcas TaxID=180498 RepID=A0A067L5V0_JATCU|nr:zinc finger protein ZAT4 [Jatropha curcas]KDP39875.1 hypothetical protein JCGZ_03406 [Jatropha curcas]